jgi:HAD superfamily hydrolase (TIGR01509 family)
MREPVLIFDFGNVIAFFDYLLAWEKFGHRLGLTGPELRELLEQRGFAELHLRFESGLTAPEEFAVSLMAMGGFELPYAEFVAIWQDIFQLNEPVARLIGCLKSSGYTLLLGSNTNVIHSTYFRHKFVPPFDQIDRLVLSHEVGHMKPDRRFYETCVAVANVPAASCVFIDDLVENVEGARQAGLGAIHYLTTRTLIDDLRRLGVEVPSGQG